MSKAVLDASVILAVLNNEPGAARLPIELLREATSSTVNLAEVQTKLVSYGGDPEEAWEDALSTISEGTPFTAQHAKLAGSLVARTRTLGLSLADRACLALALSLNADVYTSDRTWKKLRLGIPIHVIR